MTTHAFTYAINGKHVSVSDERGLFQTYHVVQLRAAISDNRMLSRMYPEPVAHYASLADCLCVARDECIDRGLIAG